MSITKLFTYTERVERACQSFMKLENEYHDPYDKTQWFTNFIASEWQVDHEDLIVNLWEIKNK